MQNNLYEIYYIYYDATPFHKCTYLESEQELLLRAVCAEKEENPTSDDIYSSHAN